MGDIQPVLKLNYAKVIRPRTKERKKFQLKLDSRTGQYNSIPIGSELEVVNYVDPRWSYGGSGRTGRISKNQVAIPRAIQNYRWWFLWLRLCLELDEIGHTFVERKKVPVKKKGKTGYQYKEIKEKVIVDRNKYVGWDLDSVLTLPFDKWWSTHGDLFVETPQHASEISSVEDIVFDEHSRFFRVDSRMGVNQSLKSIREMLSSEHGKRIRKGTARWKVTGTMRQEKLFNSYNCLVMWLQGGDNESILKSGMFRNSRGSKVEWLEDIGRGDVRKRREDYVARPSAQNLNKMRDLLNPARRLILTVCDGYFSKHPRDKRYFGK
jgi:hypothetical protein